MESVWDEDLQKWRLPDLVVSQTKLPPPPGGMMLTGREPALSNQYRPHSNNDTTNANGEHDETSLSSSNSPEDRLFLKLEKAAQEDMVTKYFGPKRRDQLLTKVKLSE